MVITNIESITRVLLTDSKTYIPHTFSVVQNSDVAGLNYIYRQYILLRPNKAKIHNKFLACRNVKYVNQVVGINSLLK